MTKTSRECGKDTTDEIQKPVDAIKMFGGNKEATREAQAVDLESIKA
jgi:hypothetical protein